MVKQNLNKSQRTLELELDLRSNNNDLSLMSIIQGRRMAMRQAKPGLVVVDLEEMPQCFDEDNERDPNQVDVARLISHRFGGRKGDYRQQHHVAISHCDPKNRGIGRDSSLVTVITSNYPLSDNAKASLQRLELFENLTILEMAALSGLDRTLFAKSILTQYLFDKAGQICPSSIDVTLDIPLGEGDTRPIVRQLRMIAHFLHTLIKPPGGASSKSSSPSGFSPVESIEVIQRGNRCSLSVSRMGSDSARKMEIKLGTLGTWFPVMPLGFDRHTEATVQNLKSIDPLGSMDCNEIGAFLDYWRSRTLAPTVVLSHDKDSMGRLMQAIETMEDVQCIRNVNASTYKMTKSLYDRKETPNLRDDILKFGREALVAVELVCPTTDSQLCIREMIEDNPSMAAFSTARSALHKSGLLFAVLVEEEITPEVLSRASYIL